MSQLSSSPGIVALPGPSGSLSRFLDSRLASWLFAGLLALLLVGESVKYSAKVLKVREGHTHFDRSAAARWLIMLADMEENGTDLIKRYNYPNPPIMAVLMLPLIHLPVLTACLVWFYLKAALTVLGVFWLFRWVGNCRPSSLDQSASIPQVFPFWGMALAVLLSLRPILGDLDHGNVNLFILFLVLAFLTAFHYRRDVLAGLILGLAIACKVTPALFLPYLVWKRSWRALAGSVAGLILFLYPGFVPGLFMGWGPNQAHVTGWYREMVHPFVVEGKVTPEFSNQSLPGVLFRLTTHSPAATVWNKDQQHYDVTLYANVFNLEFNQARWLIKACMGLFALLVVWSCRTSTERSNGWRLSAEVSLIVIGMLLFSERTWKHHCVTLVLPFTVLCYYLSACSPSRGLSGYLIATLAASSLLIASTSDGLLPSHWAVLAQVYGAYVFANLLLIAALVVLLRQPDQGASSSPGGDLISSPQAAL
jgi:alpha-1,2-mannosyltransferase